jgi:hypothetical protein
MRFTRWVQIEAEARWQSYNQYLGNGEDNYLIGPRLPYTFRRFPRFTPYGKVLIGYGTGNFLVGRATSLAYGAGLDYKLNKRISVRCFDLEYQRWWTTPTIYPYGGSVGIAYRVF